MRSYPDKLLALIIFLYFPALAHAQNDNSYQQQIDQWHSIREANLKKENGWLNLVGLYWLSPGKNSFGSGAKNKIVFPKGTIVANAGYFELNADSSVSLVALPGVDIKVNDKSISKQTIFNKDSLNTPVASYGSLRWTIIKRNEKIGIRLRNIKSPAITAFKGITRYPVDSTWKLTATLDTSNRRAGIAITNVLGQKTIEASAGKLSFTINHTLYSLDAIEEDGLLFIIFGDATNGESTYPSGRFLYAAMPGADGKTVIDFNKAYNPPCAFTIYATCPIPPRQNFLPIAVTAGEKDYGHHNN